MNIIVYCNFKQAELNKYNIVVDHTDCGGGGGICAFREAHTTKNCFINDII